MPSHTKPGYSTLSTVMTQVPDDGLLIQKIGRRRRQGTT
jgi:hypothetical protein